MKSILRKLKRKRDEAAEAHRAQGDQARDLQDWAEAAAHYAAYLSAAPRDFGIWVQLGNMHKEAGSFAYARDAYGCARKLRPNDPDLLLNMGHLAKLEGQSDKAAELYVASARVAGGGAGLIELHGAWLSDDLRKKYLDSLDARHSATERALQKLTRGARITSAPGLRLDPATGSCALGFDPRIVLDLSGKVRAAPVALIEIAFDRCDGFEDMDGVLFLDCGEGFTEKHSIPVRYPDAHKCHFTLFIAAPATVRAVRWDPVETGERPLVMRSIVATGLTSAEEVAERAAAPDVIWSVDYNRISADEIREGLAPFFALPVLTSEHRAVMQPFLPTSRDRGKDYTHWRHRYANPGAEEFARMQIQIEQMVWRPRFSFVMPAYNTPAYLLREALDAMLAQNYPDFEICVADDASPRSEVCEILAEYASKHPQVRFVSRPLNGHISAASNSALALATGDFVVLVDHDDLIPPYALFVVAAYLNRFPDAKILFSDEDKISLMGERFDPYFKSAYNEYLMLGHNMVSHLGIYDRALLNEIGGFRIGLEGSQDYDLFLRASERIDPARIVHIPHVLYHWRQVPGSTAISADQKDYAAVAARVALNGHFERRGMPLQSVGGHAPGNCAITPNREYDTPVSIIIPTRNGLYLLEPCLDSIVRRCPANFEIIIADNDSDDPATLAFLAAAPARYPQVTIKIVRVAGAFNFSTINNMAAAHASGEILCFLNNDTEVLDATWIDRARGLLAMEDIGAVGAKLLYEDGTIQHFGLATGLYGHKVAGGVHLFQPGTGYGYFSKPCMIQEFTAATAACLFVRKACFDSVGGFEPELAVAYNDVDLCLKLRQAGKRILCDPRILLTHKESRSRGSDSSPEQRQRLDSEAAWMRTRWGSMLDNDPFFSPNHSLDRPDFALAYPPRQRWPWEYRDETGRPEASGLITRAPRYLAQGQPNDRGFLALCAIMKDESANIVEWLAYHHAIGVEKFYLYDNNSTDHTVALLAPLVERGLVEITPWPIKPGQLQAYDDFADRFGSGWTWAAFVDLDEFINPYGFASLPEFLAGFADSSGIALQWLNYGPNGHDLPPPGLLIEGYTSRFEDFNPIHQHVKSLVRMRDYQQARSPHSFWVRGKITDEFGAEIDQQAGDYAIMPIRTHTGICINHYYTRSRSEWLAKVARGAPDSAQEGHLRRDLKWIEDYERQANTHDVTITRFSECVRAVLSDWGYSEGPSPSWAGVK